MRICKREIDGTKRISKTFDHWHRKNINSLFQIVFTDGTTLKVREPDSDKLFELCIKHGDRIEYLVDPCGIMENPWAYEVIPNDVGESYILLDNIRRGIS